MEKVRGQIPRSPGLGVASDLIGHAESIDGIGRRGSQSPGPGEARLGSYRVAHKKGQMKLPLLR